MKTLIKVFAIVTVSFAMVYFAADACAAVAFGPRADYASTNPAFIASGDLNNDTRTDLIVANWSANTITVFLGNADGTFTAQTPVSTGGANSHPNSIATGYFNADSNLDLAVANGGNLRNVALMFGDGLGGFSGVTSLDVSVGGYPNGDADINYIVSGDFDDDGETDLALSKNTGYYPTINDHIKIMKGDGSGGFTPLSSTNVGDSPTGPYGLATGFFNDDTNLDLAVTLYDSGTIKIFLGDGSGGFTEAAGSPITVGTIPSRIINADLNDDGEADLAVTNYTSNTVSVLLGNGDGTFTSAAGSPLSAGTGPNGVAAALIDADGNTDLVVASSGASSFSVFAGNGDGTFQARQDFVTGTGPGFLVAGNFDGDGKTDIAIANSSGNTISVFLQGGCIPSPPGMVSWWGGDNNALDIVGTNNGTVVNGATYAPGKVGQAFSFDGVDDYVDVPDSIDLRITGTVSISFWAKRNRFGIDHIVEKGGDWNIGETNYGVVLHYLNNNMFTFFFKGGWRGADGVNDLNWHHYAVVATNGAANPTFYIDGAAREVLYSGGAAVIELYPSTLNLHIGAQFGQGTPGNGIYYGNNTVDELGIYNRALSASEIASIYNAGSAGKCRTCPSGAISRWKGEDNATDSVGTNNGALINGASFADGKVGRAFSFDGINDYVQIPHSDSLNFVAAQPMSMNLWVKRTSTSDVSTIFAKRPNCGSDLHYILQWYGPGNWFVFGSTGAPGNGVSTTADKLPLNTWTFVSVSFDGTTVTMYINGDPVSSNIMSFDPYDTPLVLGAEPVCNDYFGGLIDEFEIYNRALSASEIQAIYNADSAGTCYAPDTMPDPFAFNAVTGATRSTPYTSNTIDVTGITLPVGITVTGGEYSIGCTGTFVDTAGTVVNGNTVCVRQTSSSNYSTPTTATLTIGERSADFTVTTMSSHTLTAVAVPPEAKTFNPSSWEIGDGGNIGINIEPSAAYYFVSATDNCGAGGSAIGTPYDTNRSYSISPMTVDCTVTVTYARYPVWRDGTTGYFMTIAEAYGDGSILCTIKAHGVELADSNLQLSGSAAVILDGGYLPDFSGYSGAPTVVTGPLAIGGDGNATISNITVK